MIGLFTAYNGELFKDITPIAYAIETTTNKYGFWYFTCKLKMDSESIAALFKRRSILHLYYGDGKNTWFEGRVEDIEYSQEPSLTAYGYIRSFSDIQITDVWSTTRYDRWITQQSGYLVASDAFTADTNERLYAAVNKNTNPANYSPALPRLWFNAKLDRPEKATRSFHSAKATVSIKNKPLITHQTIFRGVDQSETMIADFWLQTTTASGFQANVSGSVPNSHAILMYDSYYSNALYVGETGDSSVTYTSLRVGTTASILTDTLYADEILRYVLSGVYTLNPGFINETSKFIQSPQQDIQEAWFEDMSGLEVIQFLLDIPSSSGVNFECKIWENQELLFRPEKSVYNTWYISVPTFTLKRTLEQTFNAWRGVYSKKVYQKNGNLEKPEPSDGKERVFRTDWYENADSVSQFGLKRQNAVNIPTDSTTRAVAKTQQIAQSKPSLQLKSEIPVSYVLDMFGKKREARLVRSGDKIVVQNVPAALVDEIENTFWVAETKWNEEERMMYIVPEEPIDTLATIIGS
jgi:hypothetical protein